MKKLYKVAIVEDSKSDSDLFASHLERYGKENGLEFYVEVFTSVEKFACEYKNNFDIIFFDIQLPGRNGMEGAKLIRKIDSEVAIIFVTNVAQFAVKGYEVDALDYVLKPVQYSSLALKLTRAIQRLSVQEGKSVVVCNKENVFRFSDQEIIYIEVMGHKLFFHLTDGRNIEVSGTLAKMEEELKESGFVRCKSCFLVNMKYIINVNKKRLVLFNGEELEITRERKKDFMESFLHWCASDK